MTLLATPRRILAPLAALYGAGVALRHTLYDRGMLATYRSRLPVISIGNVTAGGSGKSPLAQCTATLLLEAGMHPVILSRGYGGRNPGPWLVGPGDAPAEVGDESLMHRLALPESIPVVIARKRADGVRFIEREDVGNIVVLDDGLQHRALARTLNILALDITDEESIERWKAGKLLPAGWLREPLSGAIERCDCAVFVHRGSSSLPSELPHLPEKFPQFLFRLAPRDFLRLGGDVVPLETLRGARVSAFSSIAGPEQFFRMLESLGLVVDQRTPFSDHHFFSEAELKTLDAAGLPLVCTEKDAVKLRSFAALKQPCYVLRLDGNFVSAGSREGFLALLSGRLGSTK